MSCSLSCKGIAKARQTAGQQSLLGILLQCEVLLSALLDVWLIAISVIFGSQCGVDEATDGVIDSVVIELVIGILVMGRLDAALEITNVVRVNKITQIL